MYSVPPLYKPQELSGQRAVLTVLDEITGPFQVGVLGLSHTIAKWDIHGKLQ